jgi:hypothetical protein
LSIPRAIPAGRIAIRVWAHFSLLLTNTRRINARMTSPALPRRSAVLASAFALFAATTFAADNPYIGRWALTIPGGGAGWLGVVETNGALQSSILWGGGSVMPTTSTKVEDDKLVVTRVNGTGQKKVTETIIAQRKGDNLDLTITTMQADGSTRASNFKGKRIPALPPAPDLAKVKFGEPIALFNGKDMSGWKTFGAKDVAWKVEDGLLRNIAVQEPGQHKSFANLRTEREFEDCNLKVEFRVPQGGNSGIYLRGIYEIQVADSFGKKNDNHNCGALYSRILPSENVSKPPGEWQTFDITLVDRHLTVVHNGVKTIDNAPVLGCTGGALSSDEFKPGPIYLQGDHTSVDYKSIVLRPVVK